MAPDSPDLEDRVRERLQAVLDPCSTFTEKPQSIVDLGLVDGVSIDDGDVTVGLVPTNQFCMYVPHMSDDIEKRVGELPAVDSVAVEVIADEVWTPERMTDEARAERAEYFRQRIEAHDVTPAYDGEEWADGVAIESSRTEE